MTKLRTWLLGGVALSVFSLAFGSCDDADDGVPKFKIATLTWVGYGPIYLAQEKGFFEGIDVDIKLIEDTSTRRAALASKELDGSVDIIDSFTNAASAGLKASVVMKIDDSMGGDGIIVKKEINSIKDLKGKKVAYPAGLPSHFFLLTLLDRNGMKISDIEKKEMEADQAGAAFLSGSIDAAVTWEPWLTRAASSGKGKVLMSSRDTPGLIVDVFTVRNEFLEKNPKVVEAFIRGWVRAVDYWKKNKEEANGIMADALKIKREDFNQMVAGVRYADLELNKSFFESSDGKPSEFTKIVELANKIWSREGVIKSPIEPGKVDGSALLMSVTR